MGTVRRIAIAILVVSFVVFVALFGRLPAQRSTPVGFLYRCIWHHVPRAARKTDNALTGGRLISSLTRLANYIAYEKNPVVLIFFLGLLTSASIVFLYTVWTRLSPFPHHILIPLILPQPYLFTHLSARSTSSYITQQNLSTNLKRYPYDRTIYHPGAPPCRTCHRAKPARSKHCSICGVCVARADHHCVWVNNCLGAHNYRWFLALLLSLGVVLTYGAGLALTILHNGPAFNRGGARHRGSQRLQDAEAAKTEAHTWLSGAKSTFALWTLALQLDLNAGAIGLLAALTAPLAWSLFAYHVYLVWAGMTTNETGKWADLREAMADGVVWRRVAIVKRGAEGSDEAAAWPVQTDQVVVTMDSEDDEPCLPTPDAEAHGTRSSGDGRVLEWEWERVWSLDELDNLYDGGIWHNLKDALDLR